MKVRNVRRTLTLATCVVGVMGITGFAQGQNLGDRMAELAKRKNAAAAKDTSVSRLLSVLVYADITVNFNETPAREAFNYLKTQLGVNIIGRYSDDRTGFGIDPDTPITLNVENTPALDVLEMVLTQCEDFEETTWQIRSGFIEVGTKDRLGSRSAQELRYYPIRDLLVEVPMFDNAPDMNLDSALNQGGGGGGRGGGGRGGGGAGGGGGGFGGGGSGGGSGSGGGGGGGGTIFGDPEDDPDRIDEDEKAQELIDIIRETVETEAWEAMGGDQARIRYYQGTLIIKAPDYIHRQINGYPVRISPSLANRGTALSRRYMSWTNEGRLEVIDTAIPGAPQPDPQRADTDEKK